MTEKPLTAWRCKLLRNMSRPQSPLPTSMVVTIGASPEKVAMPNSVAEAYRESIIRQTIRSARWGMWWYIGFNLCPVNNAQQVLNPGPWNDAHKLLEVYHCTMAWRIPREIRRRIPELIREALTPEDGE